MRMRARLVALLALLVTAPALAETADFYRGGWPPRRGAAGL